MTADDLREALEAAIREAVGPMTASKSWRDGVAKVATDAALHILDARPTPSEPEAEVCACGHPWHLHDPEAVPALCLLCGNVERCGSNLRAAIETLAAPKWRTNRGHEYETTAEAFAAGRNEVIDDLRAILATPSEPEATVVEEWGVRSHGVVYHGDRWTREHALCHNEIHETGAALVRRTRTTYADRVTEWTEADR